MPGCILNRKETMTDSSSSEDFKWTMPWLKEQFQGLGIEPLYEHYMERIRHAIFVVFLVWSIVIHAAEIVIEICLVDDIQNEFGCMQKGLLINGVSVALFFVLLMLVYDSRMFRHFSAVKWISAIAALITALGSEILISLWLVPYPTTANMFYTVISVYFFIPALPLYTLVLSGVISSMLVIALHATNADADHDNMLKILVTDLIFCLMANGIGFCLRYINEISCRRAFLDKHASIGSTLMLDYERDQEVRLMLTMLPDHIMMSVRTVLHKAVSNTDIIPRPAVAMQRKPFSNIYVKKHPEASILVADIVNFTPLTSVLPVHDLIALLNRLYNRFDEEGERVDCERIKILGDCYCCVSGVLSPNPKHAENCVRMGLYMIQAIREIRHVHITKATKSLLPRGLFTYLPGLLESRDRTLASLGVKSYFVKPPEFESEYRLVSKSSRRQELVPTSGPTTPSRSPSVKRRRKSSGGATFEDIKKNLENRRITALLDSSLQHFREIMQETNIVMKEEVEKMPLDYVSTCLNPDTISRTGIGLQNSKVEWKFLTQRDPVFKMSLIGVATLCLGILSCQIITQKFRPIPGDFYSNPIVVTCVLLSVLVLVILFAWFSTIKQVIDGDSPELYTPSRRRFNQLLAELSNRFTTRLHYKIVVFLIVAAFMAAISATTTTDREETHKKASNITSPESVSCDHGTLSYPDAPDHVEEYFIIWHYQWYTHALAITSIFFLHYFHHIFKLVTCLCILAVQAWIITDSMNEEIPWENRSRVIMIKNSLIVLITLLLIDRQEEYIRRLEFVWKERILYEREEAAKTSVVNRILLENILPKHIVDLYLRQRQVSMPVSNFHAQEPCNVAVMFASMPKFSSSCRNIGTQQDILQLLNEYISDFDMLLFEPRFWGIEKIKLVGSTYMAACGLSKMNQMLDFDGITEDQRKKEESNNLVTMVKFAFAMLKVQQALNPQTMQEFGLRIGINWGPVVAGVVGAQKPFYDIWGDTVNVASRMDSSGASGRIHVKEECAFILRNHGFRIEYQGRTNIKGKGEMETYFVDPQHEEETGRSSASTSRSESISSTDSNEGVLRGRESGVYQYINISNNHTRSRIDEGLGDSVGSSSSEDVLHRAVSETVRCDDRLLHLASDPDHIEKLHFSQELGLQNFGYSEEENGIDR